MRQHAESEVHEIALSSQIMADFYGCKSSSLDDLEWIENVSIEAVHCAGVAIVDLVFHRLRPRGIAGVILMPESHLTVRTWPDHRYAAVDIFVRNAGFDSEAAIAQFGLRFGCGKSSVTAIERGKASKLIGYSAADGTAPPADRDADGFQVKKYPFQF